MEFKAEGLTFGLMKDKEWITDNDFVDIPYVYQKPNDLIGQALLAIAIYEMFKQIAAVTKEAGKAATDIFSGLSGSFVAFLKTLLLVAYFSVLVFQLQVLLKELKAYLIPDIRYYKGMQFRKMLEKGLSFMGYTLSSTISQLNTFYLLPTKKREGQEIPLFQSTVDDGIPSLTDSGLSLIHI